MNHRINKNEKTTITFIIGDKLRVINNIQQAIECLIRRNDPDIKYNIKNMEIDFNDESARVAIETPDNEMTLFYNITKAFHNIKQTYVFDSYILENIEIGCDYFTNVSTLDDIFSDAVRFVRDYVNNSDSTDDECEILRFSFDTGEFLVGILDFTKENEKTVKRIFSFEIEYDDSDEIEGLKYYGEVTLDMIQCNITDF